jgi:hypothetical protein
MPENKAIAGNISKSSVPYVRILGNQDAHSLTVCTHARTHVPFLPGAQIANSEVCSA